ncbi:helix-turn-helix domain-containing protein [Streptomyces sp. H10-C2]|uniref:helix-turn-helix domain-containing protein n=1 Tax=unclassified Streptomyces TaxID=2593676 RepID=UPI0024BB17E7|nr:MULTISPECIES: helix-turn-helix domain-containing protein [unclassified Streptomyces]MDJ0344348.1 helix-turn-helix domain-containing protein [Streptomyces sp. PH10-H1]MDJ0373717.1 helix-turn-helix domain-containing protein [Streptomyces sp. H10-C2]
MSLMPVIEPEGDSERLRLLAARLSSRHTLRLVVDDGDAVELPDSVSRLLAEVVPMLARGRAVSVVPRATELTTGEAAELIGVSRPTMVKLLEDGLIPFSRPNAGRRVALHDVLAYKERRSRERRQGLDELTADAVVMGVYDEDIRRGRRGE